MQFRHAIKYIYVFFHCHLILLMRVSGMSPQNIQELLIAHNFYRRLFLLSYTEDPVSNMNKLVWDPYLAMGAASEVTCDSWNTSIPNTNVVRIRHHPYLLTHAVRRWFAQIQHFLRSERECFPWDGCPYLRNLVNAKHRSVGCAAATQCGQSRDRAVVMCKYRGGNAEEFGFQHGDPCTGCDGAASFCQNMLCEECNPRLRNCECTKTCHKEGVGYGHLNSNTCTCNCVYGHGPNCDQPCVNQEQFEDFDVCSMLSPSDCEDPYNGEYYREFCPAVCSCQPYPERNHVTRRAAP